MRLRVNGQSPESEKSVRLSEGFLSQVPIRRLDGEQRRIGTLDPLWRGESFSAVFSRLKQLAIGIGRGACFDRRACRHRLQRSGRVADTFSTFRHQSNGGGIGLWCRPHPGPVLAAREESGRNVHMMVGKARRETECPSAAAAGEWELIERTLAGDTEAFYELIRPHERSVYMTAFSVLRNSAEAEDIAQEAILRSFRHLSKFRGESKFATWLLRITVNEARMRLRKRHRDLYDSVGVREEEQESEYEPIEFGDWREIPSEALERKEIREILEKAVASLPEIYREVIVLRDVRQLSSAETADILGVGEGTVKTRLARARLQLRDLVAPFTTVRGLFSGHWFRRGRKPWF